MKTYDLTVTKARDALNAIIERGHGDCPLVVRAKMLNGDSIMPIVGIGAGGMVVEGDCDYTYGARILEEDGECDEQVAFFETPDMIGVRYWHREVGK